MRLWPFTRGPRAARPLRLALACAAMLGLALPASPQAESDEGILVGLIQDLLSDAGRDVRIRGFEGALSSRATMRELTIADAEGVWIALEDVVIDWNRAALLERRIEVNELSAGTIRLARLPDMTADDTLPSPTARPEFRLPDLPVSIRIGEIRADRVTVDAAITGQPAALTLAGTMQLAGGQGSTRIEARRTDGQAGAFRLIGAFDNATRVLSLDLGLSEGADGIAATLLGIPDRPPLGLSVQGTGPIATFGADIALSSAGVERVSGRFLLVDESPESGVLQGGGFDLSLTGDLRPLLARDLHPFFGEVSRLRAVGQRGDDGAITLPDLSIETGALTLTGRAALGADGFPRELAVSGEIAREDGLPVVLPGTDGGARVQRAALTIDHDAATSRDWGLRATLEGLDMAQTSVASAVLDGRGRLAQGAATSGEPAFEGVFEFLAAGIEARDPAVQQALGHEVFGLASLTWAGPGAAVDVTGLAVEGETLSLTAHGALDGLTFDGFVEFAAPDLTAFSGLAGRSLSGSALSSVRGRMNPLTGALDLEADLVTRDLTIDQPEADALLAGQAGISVSVLRDTEGTTLRSFELAAGTVDLGVSGVLRPGFADLRAQLLASDLSLLGPGFGGSLSLDVLFGAEAGTRRLRFDGSAVDLALGSLPGAEALGGLLQGANRLRGDLVQAGARTDVALFTLDGPNLALAGSGYWQPGAPDLTLSLDRLDLAGLGPGAGGVLSGQLHLTGDEAGQVRVALDLGAAQALRTGIAALDGVLGRGLTLSAAATMQADGALRVDAADLRAEGVTLSARGRQEPSGLTRLSARAEIDSLGRLAPGLAGAVRLEAEVAQDPAVPGYAIEARLTGPSALDLSARGRVGGAQALDLDLAGQLDGALLNPLIEPGNVQGMIRLEGRLAGPARLSSLSLRARASGGRYALPASGVAFQGIEARADIADAAATIDLSGESLSGGRAAIRGRIALDAVRSADLTVSAQGLAIAQPRLFSATVTGTASVTGALARGALVRGDISVDTAEIAIPNSPLGRQGFRLTGLRHVNEDPASRRTRSAAGIASGTRFGGSPVPLALDLTLRAPGRVFVRGRGLDAELGGTLRLGGTTRDVVPSGSFSLIRGRLDLLGNRFVLTDGSASMLGSFIPQIALTATTESDGVQTSVTLAGPADAPEISFGSVPELPQDEVLARLIFRRSLANLSPFQAAQLAMSLATLTGRADNSILARTRQAMGLDDLDFTVDEDGNTALRAGRYVTERVYTDLSVDSTGRGEVTINLDLSPGVTLRGRVDSEGRSGVGLFFERDY